MTAPFGSFPHSPLLSDPQVSGVMKVYGMINYDVLDSVAAYPLAPNVGDRYYNTVTLKIGTWYKDFWYEVTPVPGMMLNFLAGPNIGLNMVHADGSFSTVDGVIEADEIKVDLINQRNNLDFIYVGFPVRLDGVPNASEYFFQINNQNNTTYIDMTFSAIGVDKFGIGVESLADGQDAYVWNYANTAIQFATNNSVRLKIPGAGIVTNNANDLVLALNGVNLEAKDLSAGINTAQITSPNAKLVMVKPVDMNNQYLDWTEVGYLGPGNKRICLYCTVEAPGEYRYMGNYVDASTYGFMLDGIGTSYLFSAATSTNTKQDIMKLNTLGATIYNKSAGAVPTPVNGVTLYSNSGVLYSIDAAGKTNMLSDRQSGDASVSVSQATALTVANTPYALTANTWVADATNLNWDLVSAADQLQLRYTGVNTQKFQMVISVTLSTNAATHNVTLMLYKNATVTPVTFEITAGTLLTQCRDRFELATDQKTMTLTKIVSAAINDIFTLGVQSTGTPNVTADFAEISAM